ncbi:MAG: hypothetical protein JJ879_11460 [Sneathiella sp.]|nr:hypothetical protein [Sneathiella sp.]
MRIVRPFVFGLALAVLAQNYLSLPMNAQAAEAQDAVENASGDDARLSAFQAEITAMEVRELPLIVEANFGSFIDADDVNPINHRALKIETLYPDFYESNSRYRAMASYKVVFYPNFHSVLVTYIIGEHEMETTLINYDANGNILDHQLIAYDETADGQSQIRSRLTENGIRAHRVSWDLIKEIDEQEFAVSFDGTIDKISSRKLSDTLADYTVVLSVLHELGVDPLNVKTDLIASKANPEDPDEVIVVIPEIVEEGEQYFVLNCHIVLADNRTGEMTHTYFESGQTNQWVSDAIELQEISLDTAPYRMAPDIRAFGVRVRYSGMSRVNPYDSETLSLFVKSGGKLDKVLDAFPMKEATGRWDGDCTGEFSDTESILFMADQKSNGFANIKIKSHTVTSKNKVNADAECEAQEAKTLSLQELRFNGIEYQPVD